MKSIFIFSFIFCVATTSYGSTDLQSLDFYGVKEVVEENQKILKSHQQTFCQKAPEIVAKRYGQVIFSMFACLDGIAELRIREDGSRFFILTKVLSYYGGENGYEELTVVTSLAKMNNVDIFGPIAVRGIDE